MPAAAVTLVVTFARVEQDGNYGVSLQTSWATVASIAIGAKLTTGFTVTFQTAPIAMAELCWATYRSEDV